MTTRVKAQSTSSRITGAIRRDDTIVRLGGDGYVAAMAWTADNRQLVAIIDGPGWPKNRDETYCSRLFAVSGTPQNAIFEDVASYPTILNSEFAQGGTPYYGMNVLAVDGHIYQFLSTDNLSYSIDSYSLADRDSWVGINFTNAKLIYSPDNGRTWCNQDGSTPVVRESKQDHTRDTMVFFHEPQSAFVYPSVLQMGKDYQDNRDGYVYVYAPNGTSEGTMNELVMFRVPKAQIRNREAYEYFGGLRGDENAKWVKDINARAVVHTFPHGRVPAVWPLAWLPSVVYNAPLGVYMMANCSGIAADCTAPEPTYLGIWVADYPWGPWRQIHEEAAWTPAGDSAARAAGPQIAPKWIAADGKSFWLVWTDAQQTTSEDVSTPLFDFNPQTHDEWMRVRSRWGHFHPYFGFNTQRVELVVR